MRGSTATTARAAVFLAMLFAARSAEATSDPLDGSSWKDEPPEADSRQDDLRKDESDNDDSNSSSPGDVPSDKGDARRIEGGNDDAGEVDSIGTGAARNVDELDTSPVDAGTDDAPARDGPRFLPTGSIAVGMARGDVFGNFWAGVSLYASGREVSPFFAAGGEVDIRGHDARGGHFTVVGFGPQLRAGVSWFPFNLDRSWFKNGNRYLSAVNAYTLVGYRAPSKLNDGALRVGLGVSSPLGGILLLLGKLPVPWMFEATADFSAHDREFAWRVGIAY